MTASVPPLEIMDMGYLAIVEYAGETPALVVESKKAPIERKGFFIV